jgi:hypothetical protein
MVHVSLPHSTEYKDLLAIPPRGILGMMLKGDLLASQPPSHLLARES